jgi:long-subunit acyl-CoA synthetase (AMP-forming)
MAGTGHKREAGGDFGPELIVSASGERMLPGKIEARLKACSPLIGEAVCIGHHRPYNVALIVLDPRARATYAAVHGLPDASPATLASDARVQDEIALGIDRANEHLAPSERIKKFAILALDWWPGSDELTPTRKLKRKPIATKYAEEIDWMYFGSGPEPD